MHRFILSSPIFGGLAALYEFKPKNTLIQRTTTEYDLSYAFVELLRRWRYIAMLAGVESLSWDHV